MQTELLRGALAADKIIEQELQQQSVRAVSLRQMATAEYIVKQPWLSILKKY